MDVLRYETSNYDRKLINEEDGRNNAAKTRRGEGGSWRSGDEASTEERTENKHAERAPFNPKQNKQNDTESTY